MFKLVNELSCWWPVKVREPDPDHPGKMVENTFEVEFLLRQLGAEKDAANKRRQIVSKMFEPDVSAPELDALQEELDAHDRKIFHRLITNWRKITDESGNPISFSSEALDQALDWPHVRQAITDAYLDAIGREGARRKN